MARRNVHKPLKPVRKRVLLVLAWYSIAIHRGIIRFAQEAGWIVDARFLRGRALPEKPAWDGVISVMGINRSLDQTLQSINLPIVNIGYGAPPGILSVAADSTKIGRLAAEHLLSRGFRNFAFYEAGRRPGQNERRDAFEETVAAAGQALFRIGEPVARETGQWTPGETLEQLIGRQLLALPKPLAVTAEYDDLAIEVMDAALGVGLRVPEQVAVLGVDNDELRCPFAPVPLSSVDNDEDRIGYVAAQQLQALMDGAEPPAGPVLIPPRCVVVRQSTNILAIHHAAVASALKMIWEQYTQPIDAAFIAAELPISYTQLHKCFVQHVGHSMSAEITRRRLEHAQMLLSTTDAKLAEVARLSGFGSPDRMGRVFMRELRTTPSEYRRQTLNESSDTSFSGVPGVQPARPAAFLRNS